MKTKYKNEKINFLNCKEQKKFNLQLYDFVE